MIRSIADLREAGVPTPAEAAAARRWRRRLARHVSRPQGLTLRLAGRGGDVVLPRPVARLLVEMLEEVGRGNAVAIRPVAAELTTQQAADVLGVSRPFVIKLVREGKLPCRLVGRHRRIRYGDVEAYQRAVDSRRLKSLAALSAQAQALNMGY